MSTVPHFCICERVRACLECLKCSWHMDVILVGISLGFFFFARAKLRSSFFLTYCIFLLRIHVVHSDITHNTHIMLWEVWISMLLLFFLFCLLSNSSLDQWMRHILSKKRCRVRNCLCYKSGVCCPCGVIFRNFSVTLSTLNWRILSVVVRLRFHKWKRKSVSEIKIPSQTHHTSSSEDNHCIFFFFFFFLLTCIYKWHATTTTPGFL